MLDLTTAGVAAIAAIVSALIDLYQFGEKIFRNNLFRNSEVPTSPLVLINEQQTESYQKTLGKRHKALRDILGLSLREISNLYGLEKTLELQAYENGLDELPSKFIEKLIQVFFVNPEFIQEGKEPIFRTFDIYYKQDDCRYYLEQDFNPCFLCIPNFDEYGYAYLVFWKEDKGYQRIISLKDKGYRRMIAAAYESGFDSLTGDGHGISKFINAMLDLNLSPDLLYISFLNIGSDEWEKLSNGCWYNKNMGGYVGSVNCKAQDIFESLFKNAQQKREKF